MVRTPFGKTRQRREEQPQGDWGENIANQKGKHDHQVRRMVYSQIATEFAKAALSAFHINSHPLHPMLQSLPPVAEYTRLF